MDYAHFNRTMVVLKYPNIFLNDYLIVNFNRTMVELKLVLVYCGILFLFALIALW